MLSIAALAFTSLVVAADAPRAVSSNDGPPDLVAKAYGAAQEKRYCDAIPLFLSLHARAPQPKHLYRAAEVAYAAGDRRQALDLYRSVLESYPQFEKANVVKQRVTELEARVKKEGPGTQCPEPPTVCGDWIVRPGEQCDDGNLTDGDGCDSNCTLTACGNGIVTKGEECDDGNQKDGDGCDSNCTVSACGNGIVAGNEECDDGNQIDGDGCDSNCTTTRCGNGVVTQGEECDDGNAENGDGCDRNCTTSRCGNGALDPGEECDDGNNVDGDGCDRGCKATRCGNGVVTAGETCDDGNTVNGDGCDNDCRPTGAPRPAGPEARGDDRVLAGALTFGGSILMVAGCVLGIAGVGPLVDHVQLTLKIDDAERSSKSDPTGSLETARQLQQQDAAANARWQGGGIAMVFGGAASLLVGGVAAAGGWFLWNAPTTSSDPAHEERIP